jgi:hypothetical protein
MSFLQSRNNDNALIKPFNPEFYSQGEMPIVPLYIDNLSTSQLTKQASYIREIAKAIPKEAGNSYVRLIAMGGGEFYSSNANGDFFEEDELIKCHKTFEKIAYVYRHHNNKDPENSYGKPVHAWYNPDMHRVELIIKIANDKNADIIYRLEAGENIPVSMAAKVKHDICSICGNKAYSFDQHCGHLKNSMNKIASDGRKVFCYNPNPVFFDISFVNVPADRIAYTLEKVAKRQNMTSPTMEKISEIPCEIEIEKKADYDFEKISLIKKLSDIEKQVEGFIDGAKDNEDNEENKKGRNKISLIVKGLPSESIDATELPQENLLGFCKKHNVMFEPEEFLSLGGTKDKDLMSRVKDLIPGGFGRLLKLDSDLLSDILGKFNQEETEMEGLDDLVKSKSLKPDSVRGRIMIITMKGEKSPRKLVKKLKEKSADSVAMHLANIYNMYKLSVSKNADLFATVLHNYYQLPLQT